MKKIFATFFIISALFAISSCSLETSDNGDLDGFWHLTRVDTIATGNACDMSGERVFWSVQMNLLNVTDYRTSSYGYLLRFINENSTLRVYDPYTHDRPNGDVKVEDPAQLAPLGINSLDETFNIESLSSKRMILSTNELRLSFTKM